MAAACQFSDWQPVYAEAGIATFPVSVETKRPLISHYGKVGRPASAALAQKFSGAGAFGFNCQSAGIAIVDVDSNEEAWLVRALEKFGHTPVIVRSGSGNHQLWYRHAGEKRKIRPVDGEPIDILGGGFVVAPPSIGKKQQYQFIAGSLDDLPNLPTMLQPEVANDAGGPLVARPASLAGVERGSRNKKMFDFLMPIAKLHPHFDRVMAEAKAQNALLAEPLAMAEVVGIANSVMAITLRGDNRFGREARVELPVSSVDGFAACPDALFLLMKAKGLHFQRDDFVIANAMRESLGWSLARLRSARQFLLNHGHIAEIAPASKKYGPARFRFAAPHVPQGGEGKRV